MAGKYLQIVNKEIISKYIYIYICTLNNKLTVSNFIVFICQ